MFAILLNCSQMDLGSQLYQEYFVVLIELARGARIESIGNNRNGVKECRMSGIKI